jgi:hypothetical protein
MVTATAREPALEFWQREFWRMFEKITDDAVPNQSTTDRPEKQEERKCRGPFCCHKAGNEEKQEHIRDDDGAENQSSHTDREEDLNRSSCLDSADETYQKNEQWRQTEEKAHPSPNHVMVTPTDEGGRDVKQRQRQTEPVNRNPGLTGLRRKRHKPNFQFQSNHMRLISTISRDVKGRLENFTLFLMQQSIKQGLRRKQGRAMPAYGDRYGVKSTAYGFQLGTTRR